jgi:hypothetical protein
MNFNFSRLRTIKAVFATTCFALSLGAHAAVGLYNTGVDDANSVLALGVADTHYTLSTGASVFSTNDAEGYIGYWLAQNTTSRWITPLLGGSNTASAASLGGSYGYQTTFDLTGIDFSTAVIKGKVTADNGITDILINGISTGFVYGSAGAGTYNSFAEFTISNGFHSGLNTLTFNVINGSGPTGLRTEFSGSTFTAAVPEPDTYAMLMVGLGLLGAVTRRGNIKHA